MANSSNEADGHNAVQPRLSFPAGSSTSSKPVAQSSRITWVASVPLFVIAMTFFAISTSSKVSDAPPPLQTFSRTSSTSAIPRIVPPKTVSPVQAKTPEPIVRVNVTPGGANSFQLEIPKTCLFTSLQTGKRLPAHPESGILTVSSTKTGLKLGSHFYATNQLEIESEQSPAIRVNGHLYRGRMRLFRRTDGKVSAVNVLPIEEYLASVVDSEMPSKFPEAARQAQAIVARTYALYQIEHADPKAMFDLMSSQRSQKYLGVEYRNSSGRRMAGESESSRKAVSMTRGAVCQREKKLFCAYYSAVCGGKTTDGKSIFKDAEDVVRSVPCEWCHESPHYRWTSEMSLDEFQSRAYGRSDGSGTGARIQSIRQLSGPGDGSISRFEFDNGRKPVTISGVELRERMPTGALSSPHFRIQLEKQRVIFRGQGHGHGVGFCQWGAKGQAAAGRSAFEIVLHYYPGAEITVLNY